MPKVLPEYLELRRQQILDAAATCFALRGFHPTTMQDICREADLSPGAVYRYFPSKESIIQAMCERGHSQNEEAIQEALAAGGTLEALRHLIMRYFVELDSVHSQAECALNLELIVEAPRNEHIREWLIRNLNDARARFVALISEAQDKGEIDPSLQAESIAQVMVALYHGFITQKLVDPEMDVVRYADVLWSLFGGTFWQGDKPQSELAAQKAGAVLPH